MMAQAIRRVCGTFTIPRRRAISSRHAWLGWRPTRPVWPRPSLFPAGGRRRQCPRPSAGDTDTSRTRSARSDTEPVSQPDPGKRLSVWSSWNTQYERRAPDRAAAQIVAVRHGLRVPERDDGLDGPPAVHHLQPQPRPSASASTLRAGSISASTITGARPGLGDYDVRLQAGTAGDGAHVLRPHGRAAHHPLEQCAKGDIDTRFGLARHGRKLSRLAGRGGLLPIMDVNCSISTGRSFRTMSWRIVRLTTS